MESINVRNKTIVMSIRAVSIINYPFAYAKYMAAENSELSWLRCEVDCFIGPLLSYLLSMRSTTATKTAKSNGPDI